MLTFGTSQFQRTYELAPILLKDGIAQNMGGLMPITSLTQPAGLNNVSSANYFATFKALPNSTLSEWQIAKYPFASLVMAANAVIQQPLRLSMQMTCPNKTNLSGSYLTRNSILTGLKNQIQSHVLLGGTFIVNTPAFVYNDMLLVSLRDITSPSEKNVQIIYQWDFEQPLITEAGAQQALGVFMNKAQNGLPTPTTWNTPR